MLLWYKSNSNNVKNNRQLLINITLKLERNHAFIFKNQFPKNYLFRVLGRAWFLERRFTGQGEMRNQKLGVG
jgi:hypothetical protein